MRRPSAISSIADPVLSGMRASAIAAANTLTGSCKAVSFEMTAVETTNPAFSARWERYSST